MWLDKNALLVAAFFLAVPARGQVTLRTQVNGALLNYFATHPDLKGDTNYCTVTRSTYATGASAGSFILNLNDGVGDRTISGTLLCTFNDGSSTLTASANIGLYKITILDMSSISRTTIVAVNNMSSFGTGGAYDTPTGWAGQCTTGQGTLCDWKSGPLLSLLGWVFMPAQRQMDPPYYFTGDSTVNASPDGGAHWCNPNTYLTHSGAPGCDSANWQADGDAPKAPSHATYTATPSSIMFKDQSPYDGTANRAGRLYYFDYCHADQSTCSGMPHDADSYIHGLSANGIQTQAYNFRVAKTVTDIMTAGSYEWYKCASYMVDGKVCDGTQAAARDANRANATMVMTLDGGAANGGGQNINPITAGYIDQHGQMYGNPLYYTANGGATYFTTFFKDYLRDGSLGGNRSSVSAFPTPWGPFAPSTSFEFGNEIPGFWTTLGVTMTTPDSAPYHARFVTIGDSYTSPFDTTNSSVGFRAHDFYLSGNQTGSSLTGCSPYRLTHGATRNALIRNGLWAYFDFYSHGCGDTSTVLTGNIYFNSLFSHDLTTWPPQKHLYGCFSDPSPTCGNRNVGHDLTTETTGIAVRNNGYLPRLELRDTQPGVYSPITNSPPCSSADPVFTISFAINPTVQLSDASAVIFQCGTANHLVKGLVSSGTTGKVGISWDTGGGTVAANTTSAVLVQAAPVYVTMTKTAGAVTVCAAIGCAATVHIYINGVEVPATRTSTGTPDMVGSTFTFGAGSSGNSFSGFLFGLELYTRALSSTEVQHNFETQQLAIYRSRGVTIGTLPTPPANPTSITFTSSNTQTLATYTAPDSMACTWEISESATYSPLIHDMDPALFGAGVNADSRSESYKSGTTRIFVIGKRRADLAADGRRYSRAEQTATTHYYRRTCSNGVVTGSYVTGNIPLGNTYNEVFPADPNAASKPYTYQTGFYAWPEFTKWDKTDSTARSESIIDPQTGILLKRMNLPQDQPYTSSPSGDHNFDTASGGTWTNPNNVKADDGAAATYSGTASDFIFVSDTAYDNTSLDLIGHPTDYLTIGIKAWCSVGGCTAANATIQACLTINGTTCWPSNATAKFQELVLGTSSSPALVTIGTTVPILDSWTPAGYSPLTRVDLKSGGALGWLIRKKSSSTDQINIQYVKYTLGISLTTDWPASGSSTLCSPTLTQNSVTGGYGYRCVILSSDNPLLYWTDRATGDSSYLGTFTSGFVGGADGWENQACTTGRRSLSGTTPTANEGFYCTVTDGHALPAGKHVLLSCTVSATTSAISCTNMTPGSTGKDLPSLIASFTASDTPTYDMNVYPVCAIQGKQGVKLIISCSQNGGQDTAGWTVVLDPTITAGTAGCVATGPGCVVAAMSTWAKAPARWCVNHTPFVSGPTDMVWTAGKFFLDQGHAGEGPFTSAITVGSLASATGAIAPGVGLCPAGTLRCDTVTVDGEPCDTSPYGTDPLNCPKNAAYSFLQNAAVGDYVAMDTERMKLVAKTGNSWTLQRGVSQTGTSTHAGTTVSMFCSSQDFTKDYTNWSWVWDSATDPHGTNPGGTAITVAYDYDHVNPNPTQTVGGAGYWDTNCTSSPCYGARTSGAIGAAPTVYAAAGPNFAGAVGTSKYFIMSEDHPGALPDQPWLLEGRPLTPNMEISNQASNVSGQLFKITSTTSDGDNLTSPGPGSSVPIIGIINRKKQPTWARCGSQPLIDISSAATGNIIGTTSTDSFNYCIARKADECRTGAAQGDIYYNCPNQATRVETQPYNVSGTYGCSSRLANLLSDGCFGNSSAYLSAVSQIGFASNDFTGALGRKLTSLLSRYKIVDGYWNAQSFVDTSWAIARSMYLGGAWPTAMLIKLPPFPGTDSVVRSTFIGVPVTFDVVGGATNGIVRFGYAENGDPNNYYCMSRQERCVAVAATVPADPFKYALSDGAGAETGVTGLACSGGCTILVPAISGRTLYYQKVWRDGANATVQTGPMTPYVVQ